MSLISRSIERDRARIGILVCDKLVAAALRGDSELHSAYPRVLIRKYSQVFQRFAAIPLFQVSSRKSTQQLEWIIAWNPERKLEVVGVVEAQQQLFWEEVRCLATR